MTKNSIRFNYSSITIVYLLQTLTSKISTLNVERFNPEILIMPRSDQATRTQTTHCTNWYTITVTPDTELILPSYGSSGAGMGGGAGGRVTEGSCVDFINACQPSWGKVMFSQVCVSHSVHGEIHDPLSFLGRWVFLVSCPFWGWRSLVPVGMSGGG